MKDCYIKKRDIKVRGNLNIISVKCPYCSCKNTHGLGDHFEDKKENIKGIENYMGGRVCQKGCAYLLQLIK